MKIISKPIQAIIWFKEKEHPQPLKFRFLSDDASYVTIKIDRIVEILPQKIAGNRSLIYRCQSIMENREFRYELKYLLDENRWLLYKL